ncbi:type II toxin-antitoxin system HicA family toxin [Desulforhabdus sp. TSK]|uniref:type II toxin-antitoxin system HicA family toxin n=1 Tax=Desulforhabdus sp. TSK TaxID=2925014 RepID=UPI0034D62167
MTKLPALTGNALIAALAKAGFEVIRVKGSHHYVRHPSPHTTRRAGPHRAVPRACRALAGRSITAHSSLTNRKGSPWRVRARQ